MFFIIETKYNKKNFWNITYRKYKVLKKDKDYHMSKIKHKNTFLYMRLRKYFNSNNNSELYHYFDTDILSKLKNHGIDIRFSFSENESGNFELISYVPKNKLAKMKLIGLL